MFDPHKAPATIPELAHRTFTRFAARPYLGQKNKSTKQFEFQTYAQIAARVRDLSGAFLQFDFERGTRVAILGDTLFEKFLDNKRMEWENYRSQVHEYELDRYLSIL